MKHVPKIITILFAAALLGSCTAQADDTALLSGLASSQIGKDFRLVFRLEKNARICGGQGDAYVAQVEMNKRKRALDSSGNPSLEDNWVKIDKYYAITVSELRRPNAQLFDADNCLE